MSPMVFFERLKLDVNSQRPSVGLSCLDPKQVLAATRIAAHWKRKAPRRPEERRSKRVLPTKT